MTKIIECNGIKKSVNAWARQLGISQQAMSKRLAKMSVRDAIFTPIRPTPKKRRKSQRTINRRLGMAVEVVRTNSKTKAAEMFGVCVRTVEVAMKDYGVISRYCFEP